MSACPRCGALFRCQMVDVPQDAPCWCTQFPPLPKLALESESGNTQVACYCPECLRALIEERRV